MKAKPFHILAFRFSALGDVAMTVPVIKNILNQHPNLHITFVSVPFHAPLFQNIERLTFYAVNKKKFKGVAGLFKLSRLIKKDVNFDAIADLHDVLRTKILRFFLTGKPIAIIDKGRKEKEELTRKDDKKLRPLTSTFKRYATVFAQLGFATNLDIEKGIIRLPNTNNVMLQNAAGKKFIGIAPFAKHNAKMYPLKKMKEVVELLQHKAGIELFLFGSREEAVVLQKWIGLQKNIHLVAGKFSFIEELHIISKMNVMITMDSANMHLASLYGVPVVSVWGGTHPFLGFYGWGQNYNNAIQLDLPCRPSSVFGNKDCPVHGKAGCMQGILPQMIAQKVIDITG